MRKVIAMKKLLFVLLIAAGLLLVSCSDNTQADSITPTDYSIETVAQELLALPELSDGIVYRNGTDRVLDADYQEYYFGNGELLADGSEYVYIVSPTTSVCEAGVFKITSEEEKTALLNAFETRKGNLIQTHTNYSPEDLAVSEGLITGAFDDVVYFVAAPDNTPIEQAVKG